MDQEFLQQLGKISQARYALGSNLNTWDRLANSPAWYRDRFIAIDHFQDADGSWEIAENVIAEAACDGEPFEYYFLSLLLDSRAGSFTEADFGAGEFRRDACPGGLMFGDESSARKLQGNGPFHSIVLYIRKDHFLTRASQIMESEVTSLEALHTRTFFDEGLETLTKELMYLYRNPEDAAPLMTKEDVKDAIVERLLGNAQWKLPAMGPDDSLAPQSIQRTLEFVRCHCHREIGRDEIAAIAGVSPAHFSRLFRQTIGVSFQRYLLMTRVNLAKRLLRECPGDVPLSLIAEQSGFADKSHLGREFRRAVGVTPGLFRKHT
ncbi:AraC family transcriptional regulator [Bremerella sp. JC770]|uniref:helix-turn-helix transcriptional regulator n=1 Tax=Bremerella sp. JC770 TaxID=3232137 RepID=UPI00345AB436